MHANYFLQYISKADSVQSEDSDFESTPSDRRASERFSEGDSDSEGWDDYDSEVIVWQNLSNEIIFPALTVSNLSGLIGCHISFKWTYI